jgi:hypothetical protein
MDASRTAPVWALRVATDRPLEHHHAARSAGGLAAGSVAYSIASRLVGRAPRPARDPLVPLCRKAVPPTP